MLERPGPVAWSLAGLGLALLSLALFLWPALRATLYWYPETGAYHALVLGLTVLAVASHAGPDAGRPWRAALGFLWLVALALVFAGMAQLVEHTITGRTTGDLYLNYLEGARRLAAGGRIYDVAGLAQGVNATPLALVCFLPLAPLRNADATVVFSAISLGAFFVFALAGCALARRIKGALTLADIGITVAGAACFFSLQRSVRLGQLDMVLLALLASGLAGAPRSAASALCVAIATALKLVPGPASAPFLALALLPAGARAHRRWAAVYLGGLALLAAISLGGVGVRNVSEFMRNAARVSEGTTSGNNYSVAARVATYGDVAIRRTHHPLGTGARLLGRTLAVATLILLLAVTFRLRRVEPVLLGALWLSAAPLLSPVCWDIYMPWCTFLPWLVLRAFVSGRPDLRGKGPTGLLVSVATAGAYLLAGTTGNSTYSDLRTGVAVEIPMPAWADELPLFGHLMMMALLVVVAWRSARSGDPDQNPSSLRSRHSP